MKNDFYNEEERCGYMVSSDMKKVWAVELDLVEKLLAVCSKYQLHCFADAGTLLGTVRHKGFIPWDDDIDMVMFRDDYDKLVKIAKQEFSYPYFFQTAYTDEGYTRGHAQLRNSETTVVLRDEQKNNCMFNQGIFIDIFVLDGVIDNKILLFIQKKTVNCLAAMINNLTTTVPKTTMKSKFLNTFLKLLHINYRHLFALREKCLRKNSIDKCEYIAPLGFIFETKKRIRNKHIYDEVKWMDFEMIKLPVPYRYEEFLDCRYGDWKTPVQVPTTHGEVIFDVNHSYKDIRRKAVKQNEDQA